jgi:hypothetical protein
LALLDLLLELAQAGAPLSDDDIREEVNTFLFAVSFFFFLTVMSISITK